MSLSPAYHLLQLLGHLDGLVVLLLRNPAGIQQILDPLFRISCKRLFELLKSLHQAAHLRLIAAHHSE